MPSQQDLPPEHTAWSAPQATDEAHRTQSSETLLPDAQPLAGPGEEPGTQHPVSASPLPGGRAILIAVGLALVGFAISAGLLHLAVPNPLYLHADVRTGKLQILSDWRGRAFSAAFGSSHMHNGFDPRSFDAAVAGTPLATRSLNLGVVGGSQTEQRLLALEFLHRLQAPPRNQPAACLVLLELTAGANFTNEHLIHPRAINIYDTGTDRFVMQLTSPGMPIQQRVGRIGFALFASLLHYANLGMLSNRLLPPTAPDSTYADETADDRRGVLTMDPTPAVQRTLQGIRARLPDHPALSTGALYPGNAALIRELRAAAPKGSGVQFAYVVIPKLSDLAHEETFPESITVDGQLVPIVNLARPDRYPQLYELENWLDDAHLDTRGSALASTLLAQALAAFYAAHRQPLGCGV